MCEIQGCICVWKAGLYLCMKARVYLVMKVGVYLCTRGKDVCMKSKSEFVYERLGCICKWKANYLCGKHRLQLLQLVEQQIPAISSFHPTSCEHHRHHHDHQTSMITIIMVIIYICSIRSSLSYDYKSFSQPEWPVSQLSVHVNRYCMLDTDMADSTHVPRHPCASFFISHHSVWRGKWHRLHKKMSHIDTEGDRSVG